jgi:hypothetical protein
LKVFDGYFQRQVLAIFSVTFERLLASFAVNIEGKMGIEFDL